MSLIDEFQADLELRDLAATRVYLGHTRQFCKFIRKPPEEAGREDLRAYLVALKARNLKLSTIDPKPIPPFQPSIPSWWMKNYWT